MPFLESYHAAGLAAFQHPLEVVDGAETVVVALGSTLGTVKDTVDELRADGMKIGALGITSFHPFPPAR